jgi:hypothetical protein
VGHQRRTAEDLDPEESSSGFLQFDNSVISLFVVTFQSIRQRKSVFWSGDLMTNGSRRTDWRFLISETRSDNSFVVLIRRRKLERKSHSEGKLGFFTRSDHTGASRLRV